MDGLPPLPPQPPFLGGTGDGLPPLPPGQAAGATPAAADGQDAAAPKKKKKKKKQEQQGAEGAATPGAAGAAAAGDKPKPKSKAKAKAKIRVQDVDPKDRVYSLVLVGDREVVTVRGKGGELLAQVELEALLPPLPIPEASVIEVRGPTCRPVLCARLGVLRSRDLCCALISCAEPEEEPPFGL